jgi:luciferase family oxidoreductase group 1
MRDDSFVPLSILDLAFVGKGESVREGLEASVALAQLAEERGYERVWYAEHHNMASIASSATSVLIAHVAAHTHTIRLGSGGVMLPNHSPLQIAEQFGTLASLHPGRIDLGVGRAPGTDQVTTRALRRDPMAAESFPQDVLELQAFLAGRSSVPGVDAFPGHGTHVPIYILGSSLFGASLAAQLGLPFAFASHFAPQELERAADIYRRQFEPSEHLAAPHFIAGVNVIAADTDDEAREQQRVVMRSRLELFLAKGQTVTDDEADAILRSPQGHQINQMMRYAAVGSQTTVREYLKAFAQHAAADELITVHSAPNSRARLRSVGLLADAVGLLPA